MDFDIRRSLTTKIGPLPAWVWASIPAGAYVIYSYWSRSRNDESGGVPEDSDTPFAPEDEFINGYPSLPGYNQQPEGSPNLPLPAPDPYTNRDWELDAIRWAVGQHHNALDATRAVTSYLYRRPPSINSGQMNILRAIIANKGPAPEGATIPPLDTDTPGPSPSPTVKPTPPSNVNLRLAGGKVNGTWNPSTTPKVVYEVERRLNNGPWRLIARTPERAVNFESAKGTNVIRVRARNSHGFSGYVASPPLKVLERTEPKNRLHTP
jgi:hypothetical protein